MAKINFREGYELSMKNAHAHFQAAELISEKINYGIANTHLILASEEAVKAYMCYAKFYEPEIEIKDFEEYFKDHKIKHKAIKDMTFFINFMKQILLIIHKPTMKLVKENPDYVTDEFVKKRKEGFKDLINWLKGMPDIDHNEQWWNDANTNKNRGLYVNVINNKWQSPLNIIKDTYLKSRVIVQEVIEFMENLPLIETNKEAQAVYEDIKRIQEEAKNEF